MPATAGKLCNGQTFKLATGRIRPIGGLGTQERVALSADRENLG
jgi:hypothetical protein